MNSKKTMFKLAYALLKVPGIQPKNQNHFANLRLATSSVFFFLFAALQVAEVVVTYTTIETLGKAEVFPIYLKNVLTICCYLLSKHHWKKVFEDIEEKFWDSETFDETLRSQQKEKSVKIIKFVKYYLAVISITTIIFIIKPTFSRKLPVLVYAFCDLTNTGCYAAFYFCELIIIIFNICFILGFDFLLIYQVMAIYLEFDAINYGLRNVDCERSESVVEREVNYLVEHHGMVLDVTHGLRKMWSEMFLFLYWMSTISICLCVFLMNINGIPPSLDDFSRYGSLISAFVMELLIYCMAGTILMEQSITVSKTAFEVNWWVKTQPNIRRSLTLMIQRANKPGILDIGGITPMSLVIFPQILKTSFSFFTLMQNLEEGRESPPTQEQFEDLTNNQ